MYVSQYDVFDVPAAVQTIVQLREMNSYDKFFLFQNLSANTLNLRIEKEGAENWELIDATFDLGSVGSGTDVLTRVVSDIGPLRIRGSGGGNSKDLMIACLRGYLDSSHIWTKPVT